MPLDDQELQEIERQAVELAWAVGALLLERFQSPLQVEFKRQKEGRDPVTEADRQAEAYLQGELARRFPGHAFVGEEGTGGGTEPASLTWVVDPLDGTTNFFNGLPFFAASIALLEEGVPVVGAIFLPWPSSQLGRVFHARKGGGAWEEGRPLGVFSAPAPTAGRLMVAPNYRTGPFRAARSLRNSPGERRSVGSIAYEMALTAGGSYQYVFFNSPHAWDVAAGILLIREAGGQVLTRLPHRRGWHPFDAFPTGDSGGSSPRAPQALRQWIQVILGGNPEVVHFVAQRLRVRRRLIRRLYFRLRRALPRWGRALREMLPPFDRRVRKERRRRSSA